MQPSIYRRDLTEGSESSRSDGKDFQGSGLPAGLHETDGAGTDAANREEVQKAVRELPRDPEVIALYKKLADAGPLPPR